METFNGIQTWGVDTHFSAAKYAEHESCTVAIGGKASEDKLTSDDQMEVDGSETIETNNNNNWEKCSASVKTHFQQMEDELVKQELDENCTTVSMWSLDDTPRAEKPLLNRSMSSPELIGHGKKMDQQQLLASKQLQLEGGLLIESSTAVKVRSECTSSPCAYDRFKLKHAKMYEGMPTILEAHERRMQRHVDLTSAVPSVFKRLASPKGTPQGRLPKEGKFQFGANLPPADLAQMGNANGVTKKRPMQTRNNGHSVKRAFMPKVDVKTQTMTKTPKSVSPSAKVTPVWNDRINKLSTTPVRAQKVIDFDDDEEGSPSSSEAKQNKCLSYTPRKGSYTYVDTTKMSNAEFARYEKEQKAKKASTEAVQQNKVPKSPKTVVLHKNKNGVGNVFEV